ncbi:GDP-mannose mannosyl hydrolase [Paraburkholderia bannensis]|uniref:GDP-mannose mannosyl hydrolase n=1 Tax=Paraburkholderia TaxID=1822464 RepID=UPI0039065F36
MLTSDRFLQTIESTPLVAIDLIVANAEGEFLLGYRLNRPAQNSWFVPGGRIRKGETLDHAFRRIVHDELGYSDLSRANAELFGVYEHLYEDNVFGAPGVSTHYVVLGYRLRYAIDARAFPKKQHSAYRWASASQIKGDANVHVNTRAYFTTDMPAI